MLIDIVITVAALLIVFLIFVASRPGGFRVARSATIPVPPSVVFAEVNDFHRWNAWSPWARLDPSAVNTFSGSETGVGAGFHWKGNSKVGEGEMTIVESRPDELVRIRLDFLQPFKATNTAEFSFEPTAGGTLVTWSMTGTNSFVAKIVVMFMSCDKMIGGMFEKGLANLQTVTESATVARVTSRIKTMFITGISDEAGKDFAAQIRAHQELKWDKMELRDVSIDGGAANNLHDISDADFDQVERRLEDAGLTVYCFSSRIANWAKQIDEPFDSSLAEAKRSITRMKRLNTRFVRIMSFAVRKDHADQMPAERFSRLRELVKMFHGEGLEVLHENCMNYGGMGWPFTLELLENVPGLKLVFDTGNPVFADDRSQPVPWPKQSAWEFYEHVRDHIAHMHIKDGIWNTKTNATEFSFPGEGHADVRKIVGDLAARGYQGGLSIEPHMGAVYHDPNAGQGEASAYATYVEYGRRLEKIVSEAKRA